MILWHGFALVFIFARTSCAPNSDQFVGNHEDELTKFSWWHSPHNAAAAMRIRKRDVQKPPTGNPPVINEGGPLDAVLPIKKVSETPKNSSVTEGKAEVNNKENVGKNTTLETNITTSPNKITTLAPVTNETHQNVTTAAKILPNQMDINNPGVLKRGLIVFGGFSLLGVAYYVFFKRKGNKNETNNTNTNDNNQFRYGVLQSDDRRDNLELSRIPLTMDSDEDDDDLEIFDLGQKKSLSYVNLQTNEDDVDLSLPGGFNDQTSSSNKDMLLDIEDRAGDTLINWSSSGNKSIL